MTKNQLSFCVGRAKQEAKEALQTVYDALNKGQRQKLLKDEKVLDILHLYGVEIEERR